MIHSTQTKPIVSSTTSSHKLHLILNPRLVEEDNFPTNGDISEQLEFLLNYAVIASPSYNTQPLFFQVINNAIELYADQTHALTTSDSNYRQLIISCGIALFNLRIAIRYFGYRDIVEVFPESYNPNLLARISFGSKRIVQLEEKFLFRAISKRCTNRPYFANRNLPKSLILELESATNSECTRLQISTLIIPDRCHEDIPVASSVATLMLIGSQDDNDYAWLATGEALGHLLLRAKIDDVRVSCLDRPIQVTELRSRLQALFPDNSYPQILLGLSY